MAETDSYTTINNPLLPQNPNKFYTHFLYKAVLASIFMLLLPLFPLETPGFMNHTINNRSWELLQFVLVGIAISYGLFSKRNNDETEKEKEQMASINAQSYVAKLLQVSSVFDDDSESSKVQTWNSQCYRGEPIVVVAKETSIPDVATNEKPLLLPVRNLKNGGACESFSSRSYSRRLSPEEESQANVVLRSPIPWRSRSGRMEVKEDFCEFESPSPSSFRYQSSKSSNPSEMQSKSLEDAGQIHKSFFTPIPPPPPLPPPHVKNIMNWNPSKDFRGRNEGRRGNQDEYLSDDKEIERFIERRETQSKKLTNETTYPKPKGEEDDKLKEMMDTNNNGEIMGNEDGPDVDKKADEFIAKFREQIRLQRIASIRRTTSSTPPKPLPGR